MLKFEPVAKYEKGIVFSLLQQSCVEVWNDAWEDATRRYEGEIFKKTKRAGASVFISTLNDKPIGMACWEPIQGDDFAIIGDNCILPEYRGKGFGRAQIKEILKRLRNQRYKKVIVKTGDHPFFAAADKMYLACGFHEVRRNESSSDPRFGSIEYEVKL